MPSSIVLGSMARSVAHESSSVSELLSLLSNAKRLTILYVLSIEEEMQPLQLSQQIGTSLSATSQHLAKLLAANVVQYRRAAQSRYYRISAHGREMHVDHLVRRVLELI